MKFGEVMGKKHKVVKRLVIISAVLLSLVLSSRAQTVTSSEDDISPEIVCIPGTNNCKTPHKDSVVTLLSPTDGASKLKPFNRCDPKTQLCQEPHPASFDASGKEDQNAGVSDRSKYESSENSQSQTSKGHGPNPEMICTGPSGDRDCKGPPPPNSFVSESGEDDFAKDDAYGDSQLPESESESESEYEHSPEASTSKHHKHKPTNLMTCKGPPDHRVCTDPTHSSFVSDNASGDSQSSKESESESYSEADTSNGHVPTPPNGRMGCIGKPGNDINCPDPHQSSVSKSDEEAFAINIHQEDAINPLVCHPSADGTTCKEPHQAFGIAQPKVEAA